ncbi:hypothetical protein T12_143 [Trichinella patagoniensis]|uniref:Uncharacterized protein n=1 Tax=Trichinella patagoniensis TaxID=990121 RepID=A0A0V0YXQ2_9BILA|nr:hypothetical protein T12_143 [Trichinella patagoniensis]
MECTKMVKLTCADPVRVIMEFMNSNLNRLKRLEQLAAIYNP